MKPGYGLDVYGYYKDDLQTGDCLLWRSRSMIGWLIRLFTGHRVNHAGLVIRPHEYGCFNDRRFTLEALENGVVLRLLSERLRSFDGAVWLYPLKDEYRLKRAVISAWAIKQEGTPYDYGSLFKQIFGRVSLDMRKYFCSEFCYAAWREAGIPVDENKAPRPGDIPGLGIFKKPVMIYG